jgi:hypothetical protein
MQAQGVSLRSPDVLTPSQKKRDAEEEDVDVSTHTSWGGRGKRGAVPAVALEAPPGKRRRVQVLLRHLSTMHACRLQVVILNGLIYL